MSYYTKSNGYDKLLQKAYTIHHFEIVDKLLLLNDNFNISHLNDELSNIVLLRTLIANKELNVAETNILIEKLVQLFHDNSSYEEMVLSPLSKHLIGYPKKIRGISISNPVCNSNLKQINIVTRYYDNKGKIKVKIRIGIFKDNIYGVLLDTGFIESEKHISKLFYNKENPTSEKVEFFLKKSLLQIENRASKVGGIVGIDLTPAFYHLLPFSLFMGGKVINEIAFENYQNKLLSNLQYTFEILKERDSNVEFLYPLFINGKLKRNHISYLLMKNIILDRNSDKIFPWIPPRIIKLFKI